MYFHLIWIKEKAWKQYELNFLLRWWDEKFIRNFLAYRWVVVVSLTELKENPDAFRNIKMSVMYDNKEIQIFMNWDNLEEKIYFVAFLWLAPQIANFVDKPIPEFQMNDLIKNVFIKIQQEVENIKKEKERELIREKKKYEEKNIDYWLKVINANIDRIQQVIKIWHWILSWTEVKELENYLNEMKKIRLGTNFNKMASLILESHHIVDLATKKVIEANESWKFVIDQQSIVTNIDVISDCYKFNRIWEKTKLKPALLTPTEGIEWVLWIGAVYMKLLWRDIVHTFKQTSFDEFFTVVLNLVEYITLTITLVISLLWLIAPLLGVEGFSLYLLPAMWWLGLLLYLYNNLELKTTTTKLIWFVVLALLYWRGLVLLLNTFAL